MSCCARKSCGIQLTVWGCILAALGVATVLILPKALLKILEKKTCIDSPSHDGYNSWIGDLEAKSKDRLFQLTYWNITNRNGFLYKGETPSLKEIGPYVYRFAQKKLNIQFSPVNSTVKFVTMVQVKYDDAITKELCPLCTEHDNLTVLNLGYLGLMQNTGGDVSFSLVILPSLVAKILQLAYTFSGSSDDTYVGLGRFDQGFIPSAIPLFPENWGYFEFGPWLAQQNRSSISSLSGIILRLNITSFTPIEMHGLYSLLIDPIKLGTTGNPILASICQSNPISDGCGFLVYASAVGQRINSLTTANQSASIPTDETLLALNQQIYRLTCINQSSSCIKLVPELMNAVIIYATKHLLTMVIHAAIDQFDYGLLTTKPQSQLALGYVMTDLKIPNLYPKGVPVPGLIKHDKDEASALYGSVKEFYDCKAGSKANQWAGLDASPSISADAYPLMNNDRSISGFNQIFTAAEDWPFCTCDLDPVEPFYDVFVEQIQLKIRIFYTRNTKRHDLYLQRYTINVSSFLLVNNASIFQKGIVDVTSQYKVPMVITLPHFLGADKGYAQRFQMNPDESLHNFEYDIEPMSGYGFQVKHPMQFNSYIKSNAVAVPRAVPYNLTYTENLNKNIIEHILPIAWLSVNAGGSKKDAENLTMLYSIIVGGCAGVAVIIAVGSIMVLSGIYVVIKLLNRGKVQPI